MNIAGRTTCILTEKEVVSPLSSYCKLTFLWFVLYVQSPAEEERLKYRFGLKRMYFFQTQNNAITRVASLYKEAGYNCSIDL